MLPPSEYRVFLVARFVPAEIKSANIWQISCITYADALNAIEFVLCDYYCAILSAILECGMYQTSTTNVRCHYS